MTHPVSSVWVTWDQDSLFGGLEESDLENIDIASSIDAYDDECLGRLTSSYPDATIFIQHQHLAETRVTVEYATEDEAWRSSDEDEAYVLHVLGDVFSWGVFWREIHS